MDYCDKYTAAVKFSQVKGCFLLVPEKWRKAYPEDLHVFKIHYGENHQREAYLSCGKDMTHREDVESKVFMNQKYAEKLGIKEKEWIELIPLTAAIPQATKVILEPLTSDDWEIMELNARFIEWNLMNQIRVVWVNQVFPVWVSNLSIYCKVVACAPDHNPVTLNGHTLVSVVPKDRYLSIPSMEKDSDSLKKINKKNYFQFEHLRYYPNHEQFVESTDDENSSSNRFLDSETPSIASHASLFFTSWFTYSKEEKPSLSGEFQEDSGDFCHFNFDCVLRVLPYTNTTSSLSLAVQATTVFISASTYVACCGDNGIPPCFVAVLQKFPLLGRKFRKNGNENAKKTGNQDNNTLTKNDSKSSKDSEQEDQKIFDSVCVTVMVVKSSEEDEFKLPSFLFTYKNAIVVPKELKRGFNLEVSSLLHVKSVNMKPLPSFGIILHPVSDLDKRINLKLVHELFLQWAFGKSRKNHTYVISDGTLVKLKINNKRCDFFIHLQERESSPKTSNHSGSFSSIDSDKSVYLKKENEYGYLNYKAFKRTPVKVGSNMCFTISSDRPYLDKSTGLYQDINTSKLEELGGVKELSAKAVENIEFWLKLRPLSYISNHSSTYCGCIMISGPKGVGKTSFANAICKRFANSPYHVFVRIVKCLPLKGKRVETIAKTWDEIVSEAIYSQPSLLLFEDLDYIASSPTSHEQESGPDGIYFATISRAFIQLMNRIVESESKVAVIVTSQSLHSLHSVLVNTRGRHIFQSILEVNTPNALQREEILLAMMFQKPHISRNTMAKVKLSEIAAKTEGYVAQDLGTLVDRATHAAWVRLASCNKADHVTLEKEDFEVALKSFVPASLLGISLQMQDQRTWKDVGGLKQVKKVIQQIIMWPTKYKQIYKNYSLKPQTNILLYGAPGTGKTLLAGVVASECGLNFISIKGPELLSKYIGASEQAVRDLFKRATTARPCILFFDEFDSIAPRRGHDSTGVTDRVVNQLLTQLDGVESLEGVHVLAATSRPGLIDPALLRPGRLDKCLLCPLPDKDERKEILECLSPKLPLSSDIDFDIIASVTEHFSGADLQALLYTAHIEALHDVQYSPRRCSTSSDDTAYSLASDKLLYIPTVEQGVKVPSYEDGKKIVQDVALVQDKYFGKSERPSSHRNSLSVTITPRNLLKVASEMKPSVSAEERLRYEMIFNKFQNVLSGESTSPPKENAKRVTLA